MEYGRLINGRVEPHNGKMIELIDGVIVLPTVETLNAYGIYEVVSVSEDGVDHIENNKVVHYVGVPTDIEEEESLNYERD